MRISTLALATLVGLGAVGCGGGDGDPAGGAGFTAKVDGVPWAAEPIGAMAVAGGVPGGLVVVGSRTAGGLTTSLSLTLGAVRGPGRYALGVGPQVYGGTASVGESVLGSGSANTWPTPLDGLAGVVDISSVAGRLVATFQFTGEAGPQNPLGGRRVVTEGRIDLPLTGTLPPVPDNVGSKVSATLGGAPYNAWFVSARLADYTGAPGLTITTSSSVNALSLMLAGVTAPGTYPLSNIAPLRTITAGKNGGDAGHCCWGLNAGPDSGSITITSLTATRVQGTFTGTLQPQPGKPATTPLPIVDGSFDVGVD